MTCSKPVCERPCSWKCPREDAIYRNGWYRARLRGKMQGPLEWHRDAWLRLVQGDTRGGWPPEAEAQSVGCAECRDAGVDAVIDSAGGSTLLIPS